MYLSDQISLHDSNKIYVQTLSTGKDALSGLNLVALRRTFKRKKEGK